MIGEPMMAAVLEKQSGRLKIEQLPVPVPGPGQVLVKMDFAPVNPSDLAVIDGRTTIQQLPVVPGMEGSGTVVAAGSGFLPFLRKGRRVACSPEPGKDGSWAEYMLTGADRVVPLYRSTGQEKGSMLVVNPMTALALMDIARKKGHRAMINNAAASNLGKMMVRLASQEGRPLINVVRRDGSADELKEMGAEYVLNSSDPGFHDELAGLSRELGATLILDAVCGKESLHLLQAAPEGSTLLSYARLAGTAMSIDPADLVNRGKNIEGFQLGRYLASKNLFYKLRIIGKARKLLDSSLTSGIRKIIPLEQVQEAVDEYRNKMSGGKILIRLQTNEKIQD